MNVKFTDFNLFENLKLLSLARVEVGSSMYGTKTDKSDTDYLYIYIESNDNLNSFMWEHHQLQYVEDGIDHNFTTLHGFIRNLLSGDSTINFEVVASGALEGTELEKINKFDYLLSNYNVIKSYIGLCARDIKYAQKESKGYREYNSKMIKRVTHVIRAINTVNRLLINSPIFPFYGGMIDKIIEIKNESVPLSYIKTTMDNAKLLNLSQRENLNTMLNENEIARYMNPKELKSLDDIIKSISKRNSHNMSLDYGILKYNTLENGVTF